MYRLGNIKSVRRNLKYLDSRHNCDTLQTVEHAICCKLNMPGSKVLLVTS
jgi:hypothetical protein